MTFAEIKEYRLYCAELSEIEKSLKSSKCEEFLTLEKTGVISKWTNKEAINIANTNQIWLSRSYLEEMGLIFGHKNI